MSIQKLPLLILGIVFLSSCMTVEKTLRLGKMSKCRKGDSIVKYENSEQNSFKVNNENVFNLGAIGSSGTIKVIIYRTRQENLKSSIVETYTMLAFEDDKLIYWGFPEEYLKSDDIKIRKIGEMASSRLFNQITNK